MDDSPPKEDWEKCRDWLADKRVTPTSAKIPSLGQLTEESDLYIYLKDGTELARIIGLLTRGSVPDGIYYRTNNVPTIEGRNVQLFIDLVQETLKIEDVFGKEEGQKVFKHFHDFHLVLRDRPKNPRPSKKGACMIV